MDIRQKLDEKIKNLPDNPGVYVMYDKDGHVLYVGKAKVLKNRVKQYFYLTANKTEKVSLMMSHVHDFRYIITESETDALRLSCGTRGIPSRASSSPSTFWTVSAAVTPLPPV